MVVRGLDLALNLLMNSKSKAGSQMGSRSGGRRDGRSGYGGDDENEMILSSISRLIIN